MTTQTTCLVCGATEEPARDHTCPVCGADLPEAPTAEPSTAEAPTAEGPPAETPAPDAPTPPSAPTFDTGPGGAEDRGATVPPPPPSAPAPVPPPPPGGGPGPSGRPASHDPSHPSGLSSSLRTYGMLTHLSAFAGALIALAFVGPLVLWLIRRHEHPFIDHHGKEALNFNLSMLLYGLIGIVGTVATLGIGLVVVVPATVVFFVTWIVVTIVAAVKANNGEGYRYPLTIRFVGEDV